MSIAIGITMILLSGSLCWEMLKCFLQEDPSKKYRD
jgi:hypothetical protein